MAKIILAMDDEVVNNKLITFTAPCDSCGVEALTINGVDYTLRNSNGMELADCCAVFVEGAKVTVSICTHNNCAFVLGSGTTARVQMTLENGAVDLINNAEYRAVSPLTDLSLSYPDGNFECWLSFTTSTDREFTLDYPSDTIVCGTLPELEMDAYYEISIKDKALIMIKGGASDGGGAFGGDSQV